MPTLTFTHKLKASTLGNRSHVRPERQTLNKCKWKLIGFTGLPGSYHPSNWQYAVHKPGDIFMTNRCSQLQMNSLEWKPIFAHLVIIFCRDTVFILNRHTHIFSGFLCVTLVMFRCLQKPVNTHCWCTLHFEADKVMSAWNWKGSRLGQWLY